MELATVIRAVTKSLIRVSIDNYQDKMLMMTMTKLSTDNLVVHST